MIFKAPPPPDAGGGIEDEATGGADAELGVDTEGLPQAGQNLTPSPMDAPQLPQNPAIIVAPGKAQPSYGERRRASRISAKVDSPSRAFASSGPPSSATLYALWRKVVHGFGSGFSLVAGHFFSSCSPF